MYSGVPLMLVSTMVLVLIARANPKSHSLTVPLALQAIPSYGPQSAAQYFKKLDCFCFKQQVLQPGEVRQMPVVFVIDPKVPADLGTVTLSYTFFEVEGTGRTSADAAAGGRG